MAEILATNTNREENFLQTYFNGLAQSSFDKCKDVVDKERDNYKNQNGIWPYLMGTLSQLATTEKSYMALLFLVPKSFLRKENSLKSAYDSLRMDCKRTEEFSKTTQLDLLVVHLLGQLAQFASARLELMEFYEKLSAFGSSKQNNLEDLLPQIHQLSETSGTKFHHPLMSALKTSFAYECDILMHLLDANVEMASWNYLPALLKINETQAKLDTWAKIFQLRETRRLGLFKTPTSPQLYQWLVKFKCLSVSKFALYFYEVLSKYSTPQDLKALCAKQSLDYVNLIQAFQRKADARAVSLILDVNGLESFRGPGYVHPNKPVDIPKGLDSYPCIFTSPDKSIREIPYWPSVIMILADRIQELSNYEKLVYVFDHRAQRTYFLQRIEPRLTLVLIFESKRLEKESYIISFMNEITQQLRGTRIFNCLKAILMGTGDFLSQVFIEKKTASEYNVFRTTKFAGFGLFVAGPVIRGWYNILDRFIKPAGLKGVVLKVASDQLLFAPTFLIVFLSTMGALNGEEPQQISTRIRQDFQEILVSNWKVWPLVQMVNFYFIPLQHRVVVAQFVAVFWNTYLAYVTNRSSA